MQEPCAIDPELSGVECGKQGGDIAIDIAPGWTATGKQLKQATDTDGKHATTSHDSKEKRRGYLHSSPLKIFKKNRVVPLPSTDEDNEKFLEPGAIMKHDSAISSEYVMKNRDGRAPPEEHSLSEDSELSALKYLTEKRERIRFRAWDFLTEKENIVCHPAEDQLPAIDAQTPDKRVQCKTEDCCRHIAIENDFKEVYFSKASGGSECITQKEDEFGFEADDVPSDLDRLRAREQQAHPLEQFHPPMPWSATEYRLVTLLKRLESCHLEAICVGKGYKQRTTGSIDSLRRWELRKRSPKDKLLYINIESGQVEYLLTEYGRLERLAAGDLIVFRRFYGLYDHYAVYIGEGLVVHLMLEVKKETLFDVLDARSRLHIERGNRNGMEPLPVREIVEKALSKVGTKGYHLLKYNCEHFARECRYGRPGSDQIDNFVPRFTRH